MTDVLWGDFMGFAAQFAETVDLNAEEYDYKLALAARLGATREAYLAGDSDWFEMLRRDISSSNLMNQYFMMRLVDLGRTRPEELRAIIDVLWTNNPEVAKLDQFTEQLRPHNPEQFSVGGIVGFASILLLGRDPHVFPPYRARAVKKFLKLVGWEDRGANGTPAERYQLLLDALDEMLRVAPEFGIQLRDRLDAQGLMWTVMNVDPTSSWDSKQRTTFQQWRGDKMNVSETSASEPPIVTNAPLVEAAAGEIIEAGILLKPSPFGGGEATWTEENAAELLRRVFENYDGGDGSFMEKLEKQLAGAPTSVKVLAAELLTLQTLPLSNVRGQTKIGKIDSVLDWAGNGTLLPDSIRRGLEAAGSFNGGTGFNMNQWRHLCWLARFVLQLRKSDTDHNDLLENPRAFMRMTQSVPDEVPAIRYSLDYLAWPSFFPPIVNRDHRRRIRNAFAAIIGGPTGDSELQIAEDLRSIRLAQQGESGECVEWYVEPYLSEWQSPGEDLGQRAWLVRQSQGGAAMHAAWFEGEFVSTRAQYLGSPNPGSSFDQVQAAVNNGYQHIDYSERKVRAQEYYRFLSQMKVDDFVLTAFEDKLYLGVVTGEAEYVDEETSRLRRGTAWRSQPIENADLPSPLPRLLEEQGSVVDLTDGLSIISAWYAEIEPGDEGADSEPPAPPQAAVVPHLREATQALADTLHVEQQDLRDVIRLLQTRQQIVFYGPPGTGKTFLAGKIARFLAGEEHGDHVRTVQFHPSYAYEDFFEGYRPAKTHGDNVGFSLEPGPLRRIAAEASLDGNRDKPYFLIIDEMNRGNLAKIFGELYFLLEYRDQGINLQYNPEQTFVLPPNLFIIGTMNTSDRSIAMVDAAIRRRFAFVELHPQDGMISGLLERFLKANGKPKLRADLLNALNREIEETNRDLMIGPSYFMKPHAETDEGLEEIWKYELLPLLEEQYFGRLKRDQVREKFGLKAMRRKADGVTGAVDLSRHSVGVLDEESVHVETDEAQTRPDEAQS